MYGAQQSAFFASNLGWHLNVSFIDTYRGTRDQVAKATHSLTDLEVAQKLDGWSSRGLLKRQEEEWRHFPGEPSYSLTEIGMKAWESERLPVWDCYLTTLFGPCDYRGLGWLEIYTPSRPLAYKYLRALQKSRFYKTIKRPRSRKMRNEAIDCGKTLPVFYVLRIRARDLPCYVTSSGFAHESDWPLCWGDAKGLVALRLEGKLPWHY